MSWPTLANARLPGTELFIVAEPHLVGEREANRVFLEELPAFGSVAIPGFTETAAAPLPGQFRVRYDGELAGTLDFHPNDAGASVPASYSGRGSVVFAHHLNDLATGKRDAGDVPWDELSGIPDFASMFDPLGAADAAIAAHNALADPHGQYLTAAEGNAAYDPYGAAAAVVAAHSADTTAVHGIADTSDLALISALTTGSYIVPGSAVDPGTTNAVLISGFTGGIETLANGGAGTVLRGGASGGGSTGMSFGQISDTHVAVGAAIAWSKVDKAGSALADLVTRDAASLTGTLPDARLSTNVPLLNAANVFLEHVQTVECSATNLSTFQMRKTGDAFARRELQASGAENWGPGTAASDIAVSRAAAGTLQFQGPDRAVMAIRIRARNIAGDTTAGSAELNFLDAATSAGQLAVALSGLASARYFGFNCLSDRDGNRLPFRVRVRDAANSVVEGLLVDAGANAGQVSFPVGIAGALKHLGSTLGFYGAAAVARPAAYTQTYSTASRTHSALTSSDLTGITSSTTGSALAEPGAAYSQATAQQNVRRIQDQFNALKADLTNLKQVVNSVIDDGQTLGLLQ